MVMRSKIESGLHLRSKGSSASFAEDVDTSNDLVRLVRFLHRPIVTKVTGLIGSPHSSRGQNHINADDFRENLSSKLETVNTAG